LPDVVCSSGHHCQTTSCACTRGREGGGKDHYANGESVRFFLASYFLQAFCRKFSIHIFASSFTKQFHFSRISREIYTEQQNLQGSKGPSIVVAVEVELTVELTSPVVVLPVVEREVVLTVVEREMVVLLVEREVVDTFVVLEVEEVIGLIGT